MTITYGCYLWIGESGNKSNPSETDELGLGVASASPFLIDSIFFFTRPRLFSNLLVSMEAARLLTDFPGFASGFIIHQEDFPVPSFCTRMKRLWRERLCRIEFWKEQTVYISIKLSIKTSRADSDIKLPFIVHPPKITQPGVLSVNYLTHFMINLHTSIG